MTAQTMSINVLIFDNVIGAGLSCLGTSASCLTVVGLIYRLLDGLLKLHL